MRAVAARLLLGLALALSAAQPASAGKLFKIYGDVMSIALPVAVGSVAAAAGDGQGVYQFATVMRLSVITTETLKPIIARERPDGSDHKSMPSGHATRAFAAAAFIHHRYGLVASLPAYALAWTVGASRVDARAHHWSDVIAAAILTWTIVAVVSSGGT